MSAGTHDILIEQGATFKQRIVWKNSLGVAIDLTGFTAKMQARKSYTAPDILVQLTTENGGITLGGINGTIDLLLTATQTSALSFTSGMYDIELISGTGEVTRLLAGEITLSKEVTK